MAATNNLIKDGWKKVVDLFSRKRKKAGTTANASPQTDEEFQKELDKALQKVHDEFALNLQDERIVEVVTHHISTVSSIVFGRAGTYHGTNGSKYYQVKVAAVSQATQIAEHVSSKVVGKISGYNSVLAAKIQDQADNTKQYTSEREKYEDLLDYSQRENKQFSRALMWTYLVFSFFLLLADIPVSLGLVGFFNIGTTDPKASFSEKLTDPELLLFSLGICFCTVLVKIIWDEYVNNKLGSTHMAFKKLNEKQGMSMGLVRFEYLFKLFVKMAVLVGLLITLFNLGKFRTAFSEIVDEDMVRKNPGIDHVVLWSYIGITVIIPIISGVCLSVGLSIRGNIRNLQRLKKSRDEYYEQLCKSRDEVETISRRKAELQVFEKEWQNKEHKISIISSLFISTYEGHYKAAFLKNANGDIFKMVRALEFENVYDKFYNKNNLK